VAGAKKGKEGGVGGGADDEKRCIKEGGDIMEETLPKSFKPALWGQNS